MSCVVLANYGVEGVAEFVGDGGVEDGEQLVLLLALAVEDAVRHVDDLEDCHCFAVELDLGSVDADKHLFLPLRRVD